MSLYDARVPGQAETGDDSVAIAVDTGGEGVEAGHVVITDCAEPLVQPLVLPLGEDLGEGTEMSGECIQFGAVDHDGLEAELFRLNEGVGVAEDPAGDRARRRWRCSDGICRATYAEIGRAAGLSAPAAKRRLDRLVATGAIRGFTALVDPQALAWHTEAFVEDYCSGNPTPAELRRALEDIPEVVEACTASGAADAVVHMLARDIPHLEQAIQRVRATAPVERTESAIVLSRLLNRPRV